MGVVPLFGYAPVSSDMGTLKDRCVFDFPESSTRTPIWEGLNSAWKVANSPAASGEAFVGGDFVVLTEDPSHAKFHVTIAPDVEYTDEIDKVVEWLNNKANREATSCDLSAIADVPPTDSVYHFIQKTKQFYTDLFADQSGDGPFGYPVLSLPENASNE